MYNLCTQCRVSWFKNPFGTTPNDGTWKNRGFFHILSINIHVQLKSINNQSDKSIFLKSTEYFPVFIKSNKLKSGICVTVSQIKYSTIAQCTCYDLILHAVLTLYKKNACFDFSQSNSFKKILIWDEKTCKDMFYHISESKC